MATIELEGVKKVYPNGYEAVHALDLDIDEGELMVLVGPSGCGKTTVLRMIAGLEEISAGVLKIGNRVVNDLGPKERDIAMVFQNYALYPHMTVAENIGFALRLRQAPEGRAQEEGQRHGANSRTDAVAQGKAGAAVRRSAPAGRDGSCDRPQSVRVPDGRAPVEPRRKAEGSDAGRGQPDPADGRCRDRLRDARSDRGDDDGPPGRRAARRLPAAVRHAAGVLRQSRPICSWRRSSGRRR